MKLIFCSIVALISFTGIAQSKNVLSVDFESLKFKSGKLYVAVYNTEESFLKKPDYGTVVDLKNGRATATFEGLKSGEYAVSSFYDKNKNGKLDTNFLGIPKEPIGMSNGAKGSFGPPKFKDAKFAISSENKTIKIKF